MSHAAQHTPRLHRTHQLFHLDRSTLRVLLTLFMYVGVVLFLYPYATSRMSSGLFFLICGAILTLTCGGLRCYLVDGDCNERTHHRPAP